MARSKVNDMTHKSLVTALALGLTTLALSFLPVTTAQADCLWVEANPCPAGSRQSRREHIEGEGMKFGTYRNLCCTTPSEPYATGGQTNSPPPPAKPTCREGKVWSDSEKTCVFKTYKKMGRNNTVCAKNDVDIFNSPVEPRNVVGMMNGGTKGTIVERHPDGWSKIQGYGWIANNHLGSCP